MTGSKTLVRLDSGGAFLVDCGLFQGPRALREQNWQPLDLGGRLPTSVVLTHAHLDHCGYLPALVRQGFSGPIHCTANTAELTAIVHRLVANVSGDVLRVTDIRTLGLTKTTTTGPRIYRVT